MAGPQCLNVLSLERARFADFIAFVASMQLATAYGATSV
jgi:hypothetical protein